MIKKTLTYENVDGQMVHEDAYFNVDKTDINRMIANGNYEKMQDLASKLTEVTSDTDNHEVYALVLDTLNILCHAAYGRRVKDEDKIRFVKNPKNTELFMDSEAYGAFVDDLTENPTALVDFMENLFPKSLRSQIDEQAVEMQKTDPDNAALNAYLNAKKELENRGLSVPETPEVPALPTTQE